MSAIDKLARVTTLTSSDLVALFSGSVGGDVAATLATLLAWLQSQLTALGTFLTQYFAPSATGWSVTVAPVTAGGSVYLLITPTGTFAAGTITLPAVATCVDGQEVLVACTQITTALTVAGNGATAVNGAPTTLAAVNGFFRLRFDMPSKVWSRVG